MNSPRATLRGAALLAAVAALVLGACTGPEPAGSGQSAGADKAQQKPAAPGSGMPPQSTSPRAPDDSERTAMKQILSEETAPERTAWFVVGPANPDAVALERALRAVFSEAGWKVDSRTLNGLTLKPGVAILFAEETPPAFGETALKALQASGVDVKSATGYRAYYEEKKKDNPAWPGIPMTSEQSFVIVVGPPAPANG